MVKEKKENIIWALLVHLGYRMWGDEKKGTVLPDRLFCDHGTWRKVVDRMAEVGMNTMVVDVGEGIVLPSHPELAVKGSWTPEKMRKRQPRAKIVWATSAPLKSVERNIKVKELNEAALGVVRDVGGIVINDLYLFLDPFDRNEHWSDMYHHKASLRKKEAKQVATVILPLIAK